MVFSLLLNGDVCTRQRATSAKLLERLDAQSALDFEKWKCPMRIENSLRNQCYFHIKKHLNVFVEWSKKKAWALTILTMGFDNLRYFNFVSSLKWGIPALALSQLHDSQGIRRVRCQYPHGCHAFMGTMTSRKRCVFYLLKCGTAAVISEFIGSNINYWTLGYPMLID